MAWGVEIDEQEQLARRKKVNARLRRARLKRLYSIKMAAARIGISETTYIRWEQGAQQPHLVNLQALCDTFNMSPEDLGYGHLVGEGELEPNPSSRRVLPGS